MAQRRNGTTAQRQIGWKSEKGIATPSCVGLAMTVQVIIIGYGIETYIIKLVVIARIRQLAEDFVFFKPQSPIHNPNQLFVFF